MSALASGVTLGAPGGVGSGAGTSSDGGQFVHADFVGTSEVGDKVGVGLVGRITAAPLIDVWSHYTRFSECFQSEEHKGAIRKWGCGVGGKFAAVADASPKSGDRIVRVPGSF